MIKVATCAPKSFYGPEVFALKCYLGRTADMNLDILEPPEYPPAGTEYDAVYKVMGFSPSWSKSSLPEIHDYASLSTGPFPKLKNLAKLKFSKRPILRSFLNEYVHSELSFDDSVPYIYRDMGVPDSFYSENRTQQPTFDFVYAGSITADRGLNKVLEHLSKIGMKLLLIGEPEHEIYQRYKGFPNLTFAGRLDREETAFYLSQCEYGLNFTPNAYPYAYQSSTKVLEYCAAGLKVVSNDYPWVRSFQLHSRGEFFLYHDIRDISARRLTNTHFRVPNMDDHRWSHVFDRSGIYSAIKSGLGCA